MTRPRAEGERSLLDLLCADRWDEDRNLAQFRRARTLTTQRQARQGRARSSRVCFSMSPTTSLSMKCLTKSRYGSRREPTLGRTRKHPPLDRRTAAGRRTRRASVERGPRAHRACAGSASRSSDGRLRTAWNTGEHARGRRAERDLMAANGVGPGDAVVPLTDLPAPSWLSGVSPMFPW